MPTAPVLAASMAILSLPRGRRTSHSSYHRIYPIKSQENRTIIQRLVDVPGFGERRRMEKIAKFDEQTIGCRYFTASSKAWTGRMAFPEIAGEKIQNSNERTIEAEKT